MINPVNTPLLSAMANKMEAGEKIGNVFSSTRNGVVTCLICGQVLVADNFQMAYHKEKEIMRVERIVSARFKRRNASQ